jgi:hypothetical protein
MIHDEERPMSYAPTATDAHDSTLWWSKPLPVICLMIVLVVFIERFDWRGLTGSGTSATSQTIASGTLFSVTYDLGRDKVGELSRSTVISQGSEGEWNLDMRATLTKEALVIYRLKRYEGGKNPVYDTENPQVIPYDRIYAVQFGERGVILPRAIPVNDDHGHDHSH